MTLFSRDLRRLEDIEDAINEAVRFISKARAAHAAIKTEVETFSSSKSVAAAKRASMDLTRALAKIRKSRFA